MKPLALSLIREFQEILAVHNFHGLEVHLLRPKVVGTSLNGAAPVISSGKQLSSVLTLDFGKAV
ncbi:uncharacterized protein N7506_003813 [Penicillium brevicompactum]|uniref:uncharacterized protein n=1 Tax=Penicillium brevicompactum TaxID=5074 RepID=UPI002541C44F|nr:uncharacterized protein N7506_003813 [Penicillium brevicompactum]KAJ5343989.1 hypothetical protein N7506_003813 [Penicillium brevicompactum]